MTLRLTVPGFGIPLILAAGSPPGVEDVAYYSGLTEIVEAGYTVDTLLYKKASVIFGQSPRPPGLYVAKRGDWTKQYTLKIAALAENERVFFTLGNAPEFVYTADSTPAAAEGATALASLINADTATAGFTATANTDTITIVANDANTLPVVKGLSRNVQIADTTDDTGLASDLAELLEDPSIRSWYGLLVDSCGDTGFDVVATFAQANGKFCALNTCSSGVGLQSVTDDVFSVAKSKNQTRTMGFAQDLFYKSGQSNQDFIAEGIMAAVFPLDPGSETWKFKRASNVTAGASRSSYIKAVHAKNGNTYTQVQGDTIAENGKMLGGEWADVIRGVDWLEVEIAIALFGYFTMNPKVGYSNVGIDGCVGQIEGALLRAEARGLLVEGSSRVIAPTRHQVSAADRNNRHLPNVKWNADLEGAIHSVNIEGNIAT